MSDERRSISDRIQNLADNPAFVLCTYALILLPLALYAGLNVYQNIIDTRWRPVWRLVRYLIAYSLLYIVAGISAIVYMVIQGMADDWKEVGASALAVILVMAHRALIQVLERIDTALSKFTGIKPVGFDYHLLRSPESSEGESKPPFRSDGYLEGRHNFISSTLFDDDFQGKAVARIQWLSIRREIKVREEDADEIAARFALWMRLLLRNPRSEPWRSLTSTSPLIQGHLFHISLGEALRSLMTHGSASPRPDHVAANPVEELLNDGNLTKVGIAFFWICSEMGSEDISQILAGLPLRWKRGVTQNGKQLVFELVMSLVLCEMPEPEDPDLNWVLSLNVLNWTRDVRSTGCWDIISKICADAVMCVMPRYSAHGEMPEPSEIYETVRQGVFKLQDATSRHPGFQGDIVGLSLIELIRAAYRAGYLAEKLLGPDLQRELKRYEDPDQPNQHRLYKCEIVTGLLFICFALGLNDDNHYQEIFASYKTGHGLDSNLTDIMQAMQELAKNEVQESHGFDAVSNSRRWFLVERNGECEDPVSAFASKSFVAAELAPFVLQMMTTCLGQQG